jgi:hypothetical protein
MRANFPWLPKGSGTQRQRELILGQSPKRPHGPVALALSARTNRAKRSGLFVH